MTVISSMEKIVKNGRQTAREKPPGQEKSRQRQPCREYGDQQQNLGLGPYWLVPGWLSVAYCTMTMIQPTMGSSSHRR